MFLFCRNDRAVGTVFGDDRAVGTTPPINTAPRVLPSRLPGHALVPSSP